MNPVVKGLLTVALVYVAVNMISTCVKLQMQIRDKKAELSETNGKVSSQQVTNEQLNAILNGESDLEYIESVARDLGYGTPGERVYDNITDN
ncbi:MAG: septum formation initiator family protein [Clostridia bacterium]|nr:septum formation initiator family protein [Clostridia bacterium]